MKQSESQFLETLARYVKEAARALERGDVQGAATGLGFVASTLDERARDVRYEETSSIGRVPVGGADSP
jgi:hypothetical protein